MIMKQAELNEILIKHRKWLNGEDGGERANLSGVDLSDINLRGRNLNFINLSGVTGLINPIDYLAEHFERTDEGYIVYKCFNGFYRAPERWEIVDGEIIEEEVNYNRTNDCGCGINVAPLEWVKNHYRDEEIYKLLIKWAWLPGVVVPYNTDGKIRCARAQIIGKVEG